MKNHNKAELKEMIRRYTAGTATPSEVKFLEAYYANFDQIDYVAGIGDVEKDNLELEMEASILQRINQESRVSISHVIWRWSVAASVVLLVAAAGYFAYNGLKKTGHETSQTSSVPVGSPGGSKAVLKLSDGSEIILDQAKTGTLARQGAVNVTKDEPGEVRYLASAAAGEDNDELLYNTIVIPRGGEFRVTLPDGSKVWLNSVSSLKFPTRFSGNERVVELTGEAYFEVSKNPAMPFKVKIRDVEVEVLGTHFNVMGYADENNINTTLLEGSVRVKRGNQQALLVPGQCARVAEGIDIENADLRDVMAWKNGYFLFKNENIASIMRKVSRWYDVDVVYQEGVLNKSFGGLVSRKRNVTELFKMLELTGSVHFKMEGRRITVMP